MFDLRENQWLAIDISERWPITDPREYRDDFAAILKVWNSMKVSITGCKFLSNGNASQTKARALYVESSNVTVSGSTFEGNAGGRGGAIYSFNSNLVLSKNVFITNMTDLPKEELAIYVDTGEFITSGFTIFSNNRAVEGGAIFFDESIVTIYAQLIVFSHNSKEVG